MAAESSPEEGSSHYHDNDAGPFVCISYTLAFGTGRQKVRFETRDRDMLVCISLNETTFRLLHLQKMREDTADMARAAIERLLDELKLYDDTHDEDVSPRGGSVEREHYMDYTHADVRRFLYTQAEKRGLDIDWSVGGYSRRYSRDALRECRNTTYSILRWFKDGTWSVDGGVEICGGPRKRRSLPGGQEWTFGHSTEGVSTQNI